MVKHPIHTEAEAAILGICLTNGDNVQRVIASVEDPIELFYQIANREVWARLEKLHFEGKPIEISLVARDQINDPVSFGYFAQLLADSLPEQNLPVFLEMAQDYRKRRQCIDTANRLATAAADEKSNLDEFLSEAEASMFAVRSFKESTRTKKQALQNVISQWEWCLENGGKISGIPSGFYDLDQMTWGFRNRHLIVVGARPSQGKTAILCNIANHVALEQKVPTLIFSLESSMEEILRRIVAARGSLNVKRLRSGDMSRGDMDSIAQHSLKVHSGPLHIIDDGAMTISQMRSLARVMTKKHGIKLIGVDYLQKVKPAGKSEKRTYEVGQVSEGLKEMAKELDLPVIALAQLNRESEKDKGRAPRSSDLGDSGMIERDADIIALLYREKEQPSLERLRYQLLVGKNRDGETGVVRLHFRREFTRFENVSRLENDDAKNGVKR